MHSTGEPGALVALRSQVFPITNPHRTDAVPAVVRVLEKAQVIDHTPPAFVADLSGCDYGNFIQLRQELHATYLCQHENAIVFAQNSVLDAAHGWQCEAMLFRSQFIDSFLTPSYRAIFPGAKPDIVTQGVQRHISIDRLAPEDIIHIDEPVFLATPLEPDNWGRWITSTVPRAMLFHTVSEGRKFFCRAGLPWQRAVLAELGIGPGQMLAHDPGRTYFCRDVAALRHSETALNISPNEAALYQQLASQGLRRPASVNCDKLFLSRRTQSLKHRKYRVLINEDELIAALVLRGFQPIEPEDYSFADQIAIFARARIIVGLGGAALFNTVFCARGTRVVTIESSQDFIRPHARLLASLGHEYGVIFGKADPDDPSPRHKNWTLDVPAAMGAIDAFLAA